MSDTETKTRIEVNTENGIELTWYFKRCRFGINFDEKLDRDTGWWFVSEGCDKKLDEALDGSLPDELIEALRAGYDENQRIAELLRHNELLRAVVKQTEPLFNMSAGFSGGRQEVHDAVVELNKKYQAAIDGGALDGEK